MLFHNTNYHMEISIEQKICKRDERGVELQNVKYCKY